MNQTHSIFFGKKNRNVSFLFVSVSPEICSVIGYENKEMYLHISMKILFCHKNRTMKILIVEDDKDLREITTNSLEKERYVVSQAPDYRTALQKIEDYDYDCILLDIMLPDGNGLDLLEELHALGKRTNVIILSAKDSLEDKVNGLDLGADDYLPKPFHLAELHARIKVCSVVTCAMVNANCKSGI